MPGLLDQRPTQIDRHIPPCAEAYPLPSLHPHLCHLSLSSCFIQSLFLVTGHLLASDTAWAPFSWRSSFPASFLGKFRPTLIKKSYKAHSLP